MSLKSSLRCWQPPIQPSSKKGVYLFFSRYIENRRRDKKKFPAILVQNYIFYNFSCILFTVVRNKEVIIKSNCKFSEKCSFQDYNYFSHNFIYKCYFMLFVLDNFNSNNFRNRFFLISFFGMMLGRCQEMKPNGIQ